MNWTFSFGANFILFVLFTFSVTSLALFFFTWSKIKALQKSLLDSPEKDPISEELFSVMIISLERLLDWLPSLASISMLLGLFGTVIGIYSSFAEMQLSGKATIDVLAGGIKDALVTTIAGLACAIPCMLYSQILESMLSKLQEIFYRTKL
ncbi:MotA/TolQ/ExbB proton channel family protein [Leptospira ognonensis]|uniref:MotA/TolQ/ExbB proton channel family protein n=1 Tax=Leptospira ognonensis TaxID=2484945 RepID=A0A4R9K6P0_9LEPT|nr:MotA/TolQ/ExbB proton channel family protein [Leptospira ognonensis]TGL61935.1 MotA/TolQ/ExbB proton channel family protein [Leptospira ognonensis]